MMARGLDELTTEELLHLLGHPDRRVRLEAQFSLVRRVRDEDPRERSGTLLDLLNCTHTSPGETARLHALWGLGQLARSGRIEPDILASFLDDDSAELRSQAALILGEVRATEALTQLIELLTSTRSARVKYHCAVALGKIGDRSAVDACITLLEANNDADPALRHAGIMGLAGCATPDDLVELATHDSRAVRVGAVVVLRRLNDPGVATFLNDAEPQVVEEAARAIHDLLIADALPALAALADRPGMSDALARRVMNANFRLGGADNAAAVAMMAASSDWPEHLRVEAIRALRAWGEPPNLDRVTNEFRPIGSRDSSMVEAAIRTNLGGILSGPESVRGEGISLAADYGINEIGPLLGEFALDVNQPASVRVASLEAMPSVQGIAIDDYISATLEDADPAVRSTALSLLAARSPDQAVPRLSDVIAEGTQAERQSAVSVLAGMNRGDADEVLEEWLAKLNVGEAPPEIHLDLLTAAETRGTAELLAHRDAYEAARPPDNPLGPWLECLEGGDPERGREVFFGSAAASCRRCHIIDDSGGNVGPNLSSIGLQKPLDYLLESIVLPNEKIAKGFESVLLAMDDGRVITGIVRGEDEQTYRLVVGTGEVVVVEKSRIEEQAVGRSGMPDDAAKKLTRGEIRDLVAYLATLRAPPEEPADGS
jgi:quinoprotein glucose dehydrogenase